MLAVVLLRPSGDALRVEQHLEGATESLIAILEADQPIAELLKLVIGERQPELKEFVSLVHS
jgi:hypothetical protein